MRTTLLLFIAGLTGCSAHHPAFTNRLDRTPTIIRTRLGEVTDEAVAPVIAAVLSGADVVRIDIDSPGGSVNAGLELVDAMRLAQRHGIRVVCEVDGMAASMAGYILQACDVRLMTRQSQLMFHTVSISEAGGGNQWTFERLAKELQQINHRLAIFIAGRLQMPVAEYETRVADKEWWLGWEEAVANGAVDGVI